MGILHGLESIDEEEEDTDLPLEVAQQHKIVRLLSTLDPDAEDMELSDNSVREQEVSDNESKDEEALEALVGIVRDN